MGSHPASTSAVPTLASQGESSPSTRHAGGPSALSVMLAQGSDGDGTSSGSPTVPSSFKDTVDIPSFSPGRTPTPASLHSSASFDRRGTDIYSSSVTPKASALNLAHADDDPEYDHDEPSDEIHPASQSNSSLPLDDSTQTLAHYPDERSPLLAKRSASSRLGEIEEFSKPRQSRWSRLVERVPRPSDFHRPTGKEVYENAVVQPVKLVPAVVLGLLLNILDGVSYGMITFPANAIFQDFGSVGVSMFFMSCIISQLTYTLGGSIFA